MEKREFVIMHETVTSHDAIGNDIELMFKILNEKHHCVVYANNRLNKEVDYIEEQELNGLLQNSSAIVIYHHSVRWDKGYEKIRGAKAKIIIRYHNITPEEFFEPYNQFAYEQCKLGRKQTVLMQKELSDAYWLCDSRYNAQDLKYIDSGRIGICPPFNKIESWSKNIPDEAILKSLVESRVLNVVFVGRVAPNKGHLLLLDVIRAYCAYYDTNIKLRIIGKFDEGLPGYNNLVKERIRAYGIAPLVEFVGEITDSTLMSYYLGSDVMVCCSEHEGFCVPVIEAQSFDLPVVALRECAVPETIGKHQLLFDRNPLEFAAALKEIKDNKEARKLLIRCGRVNYESRFTYFNIRQQFLKEIEKMTEVVL